MTDIETIAAAFRCFAAQECPGQSPLYAALSEFVARDDALLKLASVAKPGQPRPNLLFAAVQLRLRQGTAHTLRNYYPNLVAAARPPDDAGPAFRDFCAREASTLEAIITNRTVGTNEVRRSACLLPALARVGDSAGPFHLIEIGAAAGFNLLWDRYAYDYGEGRAAGDSGAALALTCELRGPITPPLPDALPRLLSRRGIDPFPLDVTDQLAADWLRALVWPEQRDRAERLEQAMAVVKTHRPELIAADALEVLPDLLAGLPASDAVCLLHSFTLNQFSAVMRDRLDAILAAAATQNPLFRISYEWGPEAPEIRLISYSGGKSEEQLLARADAHGAWLEWLGC